MINFNNYNMQSMYGMQYAQNYYQKQLGPFSVFLEAKDYKNMDSIIETFPHLENINKPINFQNNDYLNGVIIRSANDDNVHKAIKYGIWTTTPKNRAKLDQLWQRSNGKNQTYLFFSAVKSGMFEGVAKLVSGLHQQTFPYWWENHTLKFKGFFKIEWVYIKDVNYKHFEGLENLEGEDVTKSKDCDMLNPATTKKMLEIYNQKPNKRNIFMDFKFMDQRQKNYIRPLYEQSQQVQGYRSMETVQNNYTMPMQMNYMAPNMGQAPMVYPPQQMIRPEKPSSLGFQMNPVSKHKKK